MVRYYYYNYLLHQKVATKSKHKTCNTHTHTKVQYSIKTK